MGAYNEFTIIIGCAHNKPHSHVHAWILPRVLKTPAAVCRIRVVMASRPTPSRSVNFVVDSAIRGYHIYKDICPNPLVEEQLQCKREVGNSHDLMSIAVKKPIDGESTIVGHVPRRISPLCSIFIRRGGSITCIVDGPRHYSADFPQGSLELPCKLMLIAPNALECNKMEKLVLSSLDMDHLEPVQNEATNNQPAISKSVEPSVTTIPQTMLSRNL